MHEVYIQLWLCLLGSMFSQAMKKWVQGNTDEVNSAFSVKRFLFIRGTYSKQGFEFSLSLVPLLKQRGTSLLPYLRGNRKGWALPSISQLPGRGSGGILRPETLATEKYPSSQVSINQQAPVISVETKAQTFPSSLSVILSEVETCFFE